MGVTFSASATHGKEGGYRPTQNPRFLMAPYGAISVTVYFNGLITLHMPNRRNQDLFGCILIAG